MTFSYILIIFLLDFFLLNMFVTCYYYYLLYNIHNNFQYKLLQSCFPPFPVILTLLGGVCNLWHSKVYFFFSKVKSSKNDDKKIYGIFITIMRSFDFTKRIWQKQWRSTIWIDAQELMCWISRTKSTSQVWRQHIPIRFTRFFLSLFGWIKVFVLFKWSI